MKLADWIKRGTAMALCGSCLAFLPVVDGNAGAVVYAASDKTLSLTEAQAARMAKAWPIDLKDYELAEVFPDERLSHERGSEVWTIDWKHTKDESQRKWTTVEASTGKLLRYSRFQGDKQPDAGERTISRAEALKLAEKFLQLAAPEEFQRTAKDNQFQSMEPHPPRAGIYAFSFARVENGIPFLENALQVTVDIQGEIVYYERNWFDGALPDPEPKLSLVEARKRWEEAVQPSLGYVYAGEELIKYGLKQKKTILAYHYNEKAPVLIDALTGQPYNILGESVSQPAKIAPLGESGKGARTAKKELTEFELRNRADGIARDLFGAEPDRSRVGGTTFVVMDDFGEGGGGNSSLFFYVRPASGEEREKRYSLGMDDYGNVTNMSLDEERREEKRETVSHPISYEKAQAIATDFVKKLLPDQLGELYPIQLPPAEESKKYLFGQNGGYFIVFGWLKQGIPVEHLETEVIIDPVTGEVNGVYSIPIYQRMEEIPQQSAGIDVSRAKQVEAEQRELLLTYFMPHPEWRQGSYLVKREPKLAYRMMGDDGVVDANEGKWVSFTAYRQSKIPEDIATHPQRTALVNAVDKGYFPVVGSKLEPERPVTRGEFVRILVQSNRFYGFADSYREEVALAFSDIAQSHPLYETMKKAASIGLAQPKASGAAFEPDRPVTKQEAREMIGDLLGSDLRDRVFQQVGKVRQLHDHLTLADAAVLLSEMESAAKAMR